MDLNNSSESTNSTSKINKYILRICRCLKHFQVSTIQPQFASFDNVISKFFQSQPIQPAKDTHIYNYQEQFSRANHLQHTHFENISFWILGLKKFSEPTNSTSISNKYILRICSCLKGFQESTIQPQFAAHTFENLQFLIMEPPYSSNLLSCRNLDI